MSDIVAQVGCSLQAIWCVECNTSPKPTDCIWDHPTDRRDSEITASLTEFVRRGEGGGQAVVLDDGAAPLRVAHGANICHAKSVTGGSSTQVLCVYIYVYMFIFTLSE